MGANPILNSFLRWENETPDAIFLRQPVNGQWREWTYRQAGDEVRRMASGLLSLGLPAHSHIAILSKNCAHWLMADLAIMAAGFISIPLYANISAASIQQILEHSESKAIFVGKLDHYNTQRDGIPQGVHKLCFDYYDVRDGIAVGEWVQHQSPLKEVYPWTADELLTIMYTSGTTGKPKGVMFNSGAFSHAADIIMDYLRRVKPLPDHPALFSYLPLCHIAEKQLTEVLGCRTGASVSFVESLDTFARDLGSVQPHLFFGVPRIWARFQEKLLEKFSPRTLRTLLHIPLVKSLVQRTIIKKLGLSRAIIKATAAAPIPLALLKWFDELGITIREIYGMTEQCALSHANQEEVRFGTVGQPLPSVETQFSSEGEIMTRHAALMMGYYREPEMTAEIFTADGFLKTGDCGQVVDGFLMITGRVKDIFKTDKGKYVSPTPIEMKLLKNTDIGQVCVVGMGIPQPIALIILADAARQKSKEEIARSLSASLKEVNDTVEDYEKLKKAVVMKEDWTLENGLMTPTLKVKRNEVEKIHLPKYPMWYREADTVVWE